MREQMFGFGKKRTEPDKELVLYGPYIRVEASPNGKCGHIAVDEIVLANHLRKEVVVEICENTAGGPKKSCATFQTVISKSGEYGNVVRSETGGFCLRSDKLVPGSSVTMKVFMPVRE